MSYRKENGGLQTTNASLCGHLELPNCNKQHWKPNYPPRFLSNSQSHFWFRFSTFFRFPFFKAFALKHKKKFRTKKIWVVVISQTFWVFYFRQKAGNCNLTDIPKTKKKKSAGNSKHPNFESSYIFCALILRRKI